MTGAVYSSALEWNYSGEEVIFDVFNSLPGSDGMNITNWDIGFLSAWDQSGNTLGDGEVSELFNNLPDGLSVGNPTYSKNSPNIIAYESIDNTTYTISMLTMNMENRKTVTVVPSETFPGYPSFSKADDKLAFTSKSGTDTVVSVIGLNTDKQTPSGSPVVKIKKMKWPVFFATGNRIIPTRSIPSQASAPVGAPDLFIVPSVKSIKAFINPGNRPEIQITIVSMDGKIVFNDFVKTSGKIIPFAWNGTSRSGMPLGRGMYVLRVQTSQTAIAKKVMVNW